MFPYHSIIILQQPTPGTCATATLFPRSFTRKNKPAPAMPPCQAFSYFYSSVKARPTIAAEADHSARVAAGQEMSE